MKRKNNVANHHARARCEEQNKNAIENSAEEKHQHAGDPRTDGGNDKGNDRSSYHCAVSKIFCCSRTQFLQRYPVGVSTASSAQIGRSAAIAAQGRGSVCMNVAIESFVGHCMFLIIIVIARSRFAGNVAISANMQTGDCHDPFGVSQ